MEGGASRCGPLVKISVSISGPTHSPTGGTATLMGDGENVNGYGVLPACGGGPFVWEGDLIGVPGAYLFDGHYPGFYSYGRVAGATCTYTGDGECAGGFSTVLYPTDDEPLEFRQCSVPNVPASSSSPNANARGKPVNLLTGNVWFDAERAA